MTDYVSSTAYLYVLVEADDESTARTLGMAALERLHASRFRKYGTEVPVELVCILQANEIESQMQIFNKQQML
jgi:hypothetical protein